MAINKKLIHFQTLANFNAQLSAGNILDTSIVFIKDAKKIWTHGQLYDCSGGGGGSTPDMSQYITEDELDTALQGKQDSIDDLEAIRENASTALQGSDTTDELDDVETNTYVKYVAQTLTDEQKNQVRENIGIPSVDYIISLFEELKTLINNNSASDAIAVLDKAILDMHKLQ